MGTKGTGNYCTSVTAQSGTVNDTTFTNTWTSTTNRSIEVNQVLIDY